MTINNVLANLAFICTAINLALCLWVFIKFRVITRLHIGVGLFAFFSALWCFVRGLALIVPIEQALLTERICLTIASVYTSTLIILTYYIFDKKLNTLSLFLIYLPAIFFATTGFTPYGIAEVKSSFPLIRKTGPIYTFFSLWLMAYLIWAFIRTTINYLRLKGLIKLQVQYFMIALCFYIFTAFVLGGILPAIGIQNYIPLIPYFSILWTGGTVYAISTQRLLGLEITLQRISAGFFVLFITLLLNFAIWQFFEKVIGLSTFISINISLLIIGTLHGLTSFRKKIRSSFESIILKKRIEYQHLLFETSKVAINILDVNKLLNHILKAINISLGAEKICIFLSQNIGERHQKFKLVQSFGLEKELETYQMNERLVRWLEEKKQTMVVDNHWLKLPKKEFEELTSGLAPLGALLIVPFIHTDILIGAMTLDQKKADGSIFDIQDIEVLETLTNNLANAIVNAQLYSKLDNSYMQIIRALSNVLETKDAYTIGHSDNVTKYALAIAQKMHLQERDINIIVQAAMLHDLGKIGVHDYILTKPSKLTPEEWEEVKLHSLKSAEILEPIPFLKEVSTMVKYHHERYDGKGYPSGLRGSEIPLGSQILTVADAFDAMITERAYRGVKKKFTIEEAIQELIDCSDTQFNSNIVKIFIEALRENPNLVISAQLSHRK
ncbi:MAG: HD domain-containing phosphohydrolase [Elusimicrobiota bacterium]